MQVETRLGTQGDVPALVELYRRFRESLVSERGGARYLAKEAFAEPLDAHFEAIVADNQRLVLLGTLDDVPVGTAVARLEELSDSSHLAIVEVLYVDPPSARLVSARSFSRPWSTGLGKATPPDSTYRCSLVRGKRRISSKARVSLHACLSCTEG